MWRGCCRPNISPRSFTTYCVCLELRSLPSTGITQLRRYYEPLRHPRASGLSLAGFRLIVVPTTPWGFPCCVRFPCVHAAATTPAQRLGVLIRSFAQPYQPSPKGLSGRPAHCPFRGLLGVHSRYGLHTRAVTVYRDTSGRPAFSAARTAYHTRDGNHPFRPSRLATALRFSSRGGWEGDCRQGGQAVEYGDEGRLSSSWPLLSRPR